MTDPLPKRRWYRLSPDRFVVGLLIVVCLLWLSQTFQWFGFNHHRGRTVLIAVAAVGANALLMLLQWVAALIFARRFQFGIRSLLAFCLASSIAAGWLALEMQRARRQVQVVEGINSVGGAFYDWQFDAENDRNSNSEPPEPPWLRTMLGDDFFSAVVGIYYNNDTTITDVELKRLNELPQLQVLSLNCTKITNAGLEYLKQLTQFQVLFLSYTNITDGGLEYVKDLKQLRKVYLVDTKISDAGVAQLQQALPDCQIFH
jgi:hypothetical protein